MILAPKSCSTLGSIRHILRPGLVFLCLAVTILLFLAVPPRLFAFDWKGNARSAIDQLQDLLDQAKEMNLQSVKNYWSEIRPSISGVLPWIDPFLGAQSSGLAFFEQQLKAARGLYDRGEYVAIFKVLRLNILNNQLQASIKQRRQTIADIEQIIKTALTPPEKLAGRPAALQAKYQKQLAALLDPVYLPEIYPKTIEFRDRGGRCWVTLEIMTNLTYDTSQSNQNARVSSYFNTIATDILLDQVFLNDDFAGYDIRALYFKRDFKNQHSLEESEKAEYLVKNSDIAAFRQARLTSQALADASLIFIGGKRIQLVLSQGVE